MAGYQVASTFYKNTRDLEYVNVNKNYSCISLNKHDISIKTSK